MKRFHAFLSWLGIPKHLFNDYKVLFANSFNSILISLDIQVHQVCKTVSEFSLEFRTTRDRYSMKIESSLKLKLQDFHCNMFHDQGPADVGEEAGG